MYNSSEQLLFLRDKFYTVELKTRVHVTIAQACARIPDVSPDASLPS